MDRLVSIDTEHCTLNGWMLDIPVLVHWVETHRFPGHGPTIRYLAAHVRWLFEGDGRFNLYRVLCELASLTTYRHVPDAPFRLVYKIPPEERYFLPGFLDNPDEHFKRFDMKYYGDNTIVSIADQRVSGYSILEKDHND